MTYRADDVIKQMGLEQMAIEYMEKEQMSQRQAKISFFSSPCLLGVLLYKDLDVKSER